jgi:hypothetical protein
MKVFVFVIPTMGRVNSILRTSLLQEMRGVPDSRVIVLSPFAQTPSFLKEFPSVTHVPIDPISPAFVRSIVRWREIFLKIDKPFFWRARMIERSIEDRQKYTVLTNKEKVLRAIAIVAKPFRFFLIPLFDYIEERLLPTSSYKKFIQTYRPDAIILGTASEPQDLVWLALSRIYKIPAFVVDMPWSYFDTRFSSVPRKAYYLCWSEKTRNKFLDLYPTDSALLYTTGSQRYDFYVRHFPKQTREEFLRSISVDPAKKLITYFASSDVWHSHQVDVTELILEKIQQGELPSDTHVLIRLGWKQEVSGEFKKLSEQYKNLSFLRAEDTPNQDYPAHLVYYSVVSLTDSSSLALDAAVLDKPMIFTGLTGLSYAHPDEIGIKQIYAYEFIQEALETGGVRVAYEPHEFISLIAQYIKDPTKDADGRKRLVERYLGSVDGYSGKRMAEIIVNKV